MAEVEPSVAELTRMKLRLHHKVGQMNLAIFRRVGINLEDSVTLSNTGSNGLIPGDVEMAGGVCKAILQRAVEIQLEGHVRCFYDCTVLVHITDDTHRV